MTLDRDKLAKILGLLSSDKIGEMVSAARAADALIRNANTSWAEVLKQSVLKQSAIDDDAHALFAELRLGTENDKLREMVMRLSAENHALREQVARRLAHRILDRVKQSGQALLALAIAFERIAFLSRQLAARFRNNEFCTQRVVVHLVAAGIALTLGIVAFLSHQDVAMLGGPSVRSGTIASSGQQAPGRQIERTTSGGRVARGPFWPIIKCRYGGTQNDATAGTAGNCGCPGRRFGKPASNSCRRCYSAGGGSATFRCFTCSGRGTGDSANHIGHHLATTNATPAQPAAVRRRNSCARDAR